MVESAKAWAACERIRPEDRVNSCPGSRPELRRNGCCSRALVDQRIASANFAPEHAGSRPLQGDAPHESRSTPPNKVLRRPKRVDLNKSFPQVFPDAVSRASGVTGSWLVFLAFYVGGVSIVFELLKAFTIEAFVEIHKTWELPDSENEHLKAFRIGVRCAHRGGGQLSGSARAATADGRVRPQPSNSCVAARVDPLYNDAPPHSTRHRIRHPRPYMADADASQRTPPAAPSFVEVGAQRNGSPKSAHGGGGAGTSNASVAARVGPHP